MSQTKSKKEITYEQAMKRLEEISEKLESSELSIDKSIELFEESIKLIAFCDSKLKNIKQRIEIVSVGNKEEIS